MNKLVIVGNGFDLAHGLPTSYKHFIDDFWKNIGTQIDSEKIKKIIEVNGDRNSLRFLHDKFSNFEEFQENIVKYENHPFINIRYDPTTIRVYHKSNPGRIFFSIKNEFFRNLNTKSLTNWVDIEHEYYKLLKVILKSTSIDLKSKKKQVLKLNVEFEQIKNLFEKYLIQNISPRIDNMEIPKLSDRFFDSFDMEFLTEKTSKHKIEFENHKSEFPREDWSSILKYQSNFKLYNTDIGEGKRALENLSEIIFHTVFLNFNYTDTITKYNLVLDELHYCKSAEIKIHGELKSKENKINFGFGDEIDEDYKFIENLNDNEFLKNFKSFNYSQNSNYKKLLDFIYAEKFQVYIMGHSCGLSDRTLLNTIFEHENCRSIKVFYHKRDDDSDNFTEIIQNISRHFNSKKEMRAKLVNKSLCKPLPQNIRFQKKES